MKYETGFLLPCGHLACNLKLLQSCVRKKGDALFLRMDAALMSVAQWVMGGPAMSGCCVPLHCAKAMRTKLC
jgi:hypothetical protein